MFKVKTADDTESQPTVAICQNVVEQVIFRLFSTWMLQGSNVAEKHVSNILKHTRIVLVWADSSDWGSKLFV